VKNARRLRQVGYLLDMMIAHFGGMNGLAQAWIRQYEAARAQNPGSKQVQDFFLANFKLMEYCDANQEDEVHDPSVADLSADDLAVGVMQVARVLIQQEPQLAIDAARQLGWDIFPPAAGDQHADHPAESLTSRLGLE
jgi:hypothetical protein